MASSSARTRRPTPARASASAAGQPRPPIPTTSTLPAAIRAWSAAEVLIEAEVTLPGVGEQRDHVLARAELPRAGEGRGDGRACADADQEARFAREALGRSVGVVVLHGADLADDRGVVVAGDEAGREPLALRGAALAAREGGAGIRLDGDDAHFRVGGAERAAHAADRAAGPHSGDEGVDAEIAHGVQDLPRGGLRVHARVLRVVELLRQEGGGEVRGEL